MSSIPRPLVQVPDPSSAVLPLRKKEEIWLDAFSNPVSGMKSFSSNMALVDLNGDGDYKLIMADVEQKKMRIYKGTHIHWEQNLLDHPSGIGFFYPDSESPSIPSLSVASGGQIFIYRHLRPYLKFSLPGMEISALEKENMKEINILQASSICCLGTLRKSLDEPSAVSMVVCGTEDKKVYILHQTGTTVAEKLELESVPAFLAVVGLYDIEYRITVACRDGRVWTIKNGKVMSVVLELESPPVGVVRVDKNIFVGCMDSTLHSFHFKGKKSFSLFMPAPIAAMELLEVTRAKLRKVLVVALQSGEIRVYNGKTLVNSFQVHDRVCGLCVGFLGREEGVLVISCDSGALHFKILKRTADLEVKEGGDPGPPPEQEQPLDVPKKTKLYVEQTQREREMAGVMHRAFQREMCKLRVKAAREYVRLLQSGHGSISSKSSAQVRVQAFIQGLGPEFRVTATVENVGGEGLRGLGLSCQGNPTLYAVGSPSLRVIPVLIPGVPYNEAFQVECLSPSSGVDSLRFFLSSSDGALLLACTLPMPMSELSLLD